MIPTEQWEWFGHTGHLIVSKDCLFHLSTKVGDVLVSTVGEYYPQHKRTGDKLGEMEEIGYQRKYETMVFRLAKGKRLECGCPNVDFTELMMEPYNDPANATSGHLEVCQRAAVGEFNKEEGAR